MNERETIGFTPEERIFAAISHAAIILPYVGAAVPLGIWATHRNKSKWVSYQALQAIIYQILQYLLIMIAGCLIIPLSITPIFFVRTENPESIMGWMMMLSFSPYLFWGLLIMLGLLGGVLCAFGKNFRYPVIGRKIHAYISKQNTETIPGGEND